MTNPLRVLMAASDELFEQLFREVIEDGGHHLTIFNPLPNAKAFLDEARTGRYDVAVVTNVCLPLDYSIGLIAPLRQSCSAKVIVMSGAADDKSREAARRGGAIAFHKLPLSSGIQILAAIEAAAR